MLRKISLALFATALAGCSSLSSGPGEMAGVMMPIVQVETMVPVADYRIGVQDVLNVDVFQVPDLTFVGDNAIRVDASGLIEMPLIGTLQAAGRTPAELGGDIRSRLAIRFLQNPQVSVRVAEAANQKITVDGSVVEPGVYAMKGQTTLLQAVAMAKGATRVSDLRNVAVFRTVDDQRMVALFDLAAIRSGQAVDPLLQGDDIVVVDTSRLSAAMRDILAALPGIGAFVYYTR